MPKQELVLRGTVCPFVVSFAFKPRKNVAMNFVRLLSAKVRDLTTARQARTHCRFGTTASRSGKARKTMHSGGSIWCEPNRTATFARYTAPDECVYTS